MRLLKLSSLFVFIFFVALFIHNCSKDTPAQFHDVSPNLMTDSIIYADGGERFIYRVPFGAYNAPDESVTFIDYPSWLIADNDSIFGIVPSNFKDTSLSVIITQAGIPDTLPLLIRKSQYIVVLGDTRTGHAIHQQVVNELMECKPIAVFHTGDLVNNGYMPSDWNIFNEITSEMRARSEFFPALGNHEFMSPLYFDNFVLPGNEQWYSVDRNGIHFIILNTCVDIDVSSEQYNWLVTDLQNVADSIKFVAAVFHHPPYSTGMHTEDEMGLRDILVPLFEEYDVDIVFNGHDHDYERSYCGGIYYIVTGGGGAPLRGQARTHPCSQIFESRYHFCRLSIIGSALKVNVYDQNGELFDQFMMFD